MKEKIKRWIREWMEYPDYSPKKASDLRAVSFTQESPISSKHKNIYMCHCTQWANGEGYIFDFSVFNTRSREEKEMHFSLDDNEIQLLIACLNDMGEFEL